MQIVINNEFVINLILLLIFGLLIFKSKYMKLNNDYLSKNNTDIIKGISVLVVILCHIAMFSVNDGMIKRIFLNSGILAVAIFIFVSGYGLMSQLLKKENYLKGFWQKILNLFIIFIVSNIAITIISNLFLKTNYNIKDILLSSLQFNFSNGRELWFVACIIFMYISFFISFKLSKHKGIIGVIISTFIYVFICKLVGKGAWWYNCVSCFSLGVLFAMYKDRILNFYKKNYYVKGIVVLFLFIVSMILYIKGSSSMQFLIPIIFVILVTIILVKVKLQSNIFLYLNKISFEIYLTHLIVLQVAFQSLVERNSIYLLFLFLIMVILSLIVQKICKLILKILRLA